MRNIRWTVGRRIAAITAIGLVTTALVAIVSWTSARTVENDAEVVRNHTEARSLARVSNDW